MHNLHFINYFNSSAGVDDFERMYALEDCQCFRMTHTCAGCLQYMHNLHFINYFNSSAGVDDFERMYALEDCQCFRMTHTCAGCLPEIAFTEFNIS